LASYNRFHNNLYRDTLIVAFGNSLTSVFSGFVVFSILGVMAHEQNTTVANVTAAGPGLTFITYPQSVLLFPAAPLWSALFFLMLITLALSTMFPTVEIIATSLIDQYAKVETYSLHAHNRTQLRPYKFWVTMATCIVLFLLGLPLTTNSGMYVLQLMDSYGVSYPLLTLGLIEIVILSWRYGAEQLHANAEVVCRWHGCA
jgi:solute carrier family 6 amino acid transporter-like protein 5/7/9/14